MNKQERDELRAWCESQSHDVVVETAARVVSLTSEIGKLLDRVDELEEEVQRSRSEVAALMKAGLENESNESDVKTNCGMLRRERPQQ